MENSFRKFKLVFRAMWLFHPRVSPPFPALRMSPGASEETGSKDMNATVLASISLENVIVEVGAPL
jgi:hypothetical protein